MRKESSGRTLHYRRARFLKSGDNLQTRLVSALRRRRKVGTRREPLGKPPATAYRLINQYSSQLKMLFGHMFVYTDGSSQLLFTAADDAEEYPLAVIVAEPDETGRRREFLESILYFGVFEDHVVLLQSLSLRSRQFEQHLSWLLRECSLLANGDGLVLSDSPTRATKKKIETAHVKSIELGLPLVETETATVNERKMAVLKSTGPVRELLNSILGKDGMRGLRLEDALDGNLEMLLEFRYKRMTTQKGQRLLDNIAVALRDRDEDEVRINLNGGGRVEGRDLKLTGTVTVESINGVIDVNDLYPKMREWVQGCIEDGMVDP